MYTLCLHIHLHFIDPQFYFETELYRRGKLKRKQIEIKKKKRKSHKIQNTFEENMMYNIIHVKITSRNSGEKKGMRTMNYVK